jgi:hypothetical protein
MKKHAPRLPAPYLKRIWLDQVHPVDSKTCPFSLPLFARGDFVGSG